jgi:hypothetical protein
MDVAVVINPHNQTTTKQTAPVFSIDLALTKGPKGDFAWRQVFEASFWRICGASISYAVVSFALMIVLKYSASFQSLVADLVLNQQSQSLFVLVGIVDVCFECFAGA